MEELRLLFFISWLIINQHATINAPPKKPTAGIIIIRLVLFKSTNIDWSDISETILHRPTDNNEADQLRAITKATLLLDIPQ